MKERIASRYELAKEHYAEYGVDVTNALQTLSSLSLSIHCWQGDDVGGFETPDAELSGGGIQVTGSYPGRARTLDELRADLDAVYSLLPGTHRLNLHAIYGDFQGKRVDRDAIEPTHYAGWLDWAKEKNIALDFNATCFSHPMASTGFTLSSKDESVRAFWIEHVKRAREITAHFGRAQGTPSIHNVWIPDGSKDTPVDRMGHRTLLRESLDSALATRYDEKEMLDALECKLFGIGSESFVVGSHEFYMGYALRNNTTLCLDMGHFHPTEEAGDKVSALLQYFPTLLFHITRGVRWDSDHVVTYNDSLVFLAQELVRSGRIASLYLGLDFFDATLNRVGAWVVGARAALKAILFALLEPHAQLVAYEEEGNYFARLALLEEMKSMPFGAVWDYYCESKGIVVDGDVRAEVAAYEERVLRARQ